MTEIIKLTPNAQEQAKVLLSETEESKDGLRVAVIGGGCSGLKYKLGFDSETESDVVYEYSNGLRVMVDEKSALHLIGCELAYYNDIDRSGFEVVNPNAKNTCGCGESFS